MIARHRATRRARLVPPAARPHSFLLSLFAATGLVLSLGVGAPGETSTRTTADAARTVDAAGLGLSSLLSPVRSTRETDASQGALLLKANAGTVADQLSRSLRRAAAGEQVPRRTMPGTGRLRRNSWEGPNECASLGATTEHTVCAFGDPEGDRTVVAFGSSHMTMWMAGLNEAAERRDTRVFGLFKFGCTPFDLRSSRQGVEWQDCSDWREWAIDQVAEIAPDIVVVASHSDFDVIDDDGDLLRRKAYRRAVGRGAAGLTARLREHAADVVVLGDVSPRTRDPQKCMRRFDRSYRRCESPKDAAHERLVAVTERAALRAGGDFFDTSELMCVRGRCPVAAAKRFVYRDQDHVSRVWSRHVGPALATRVGVL